MSKATAGSLTEAAAVAAVRRPNYDLQETGLLVQGELSFEQWENVGAWLQVADNAIQWWIGDWMVYGESRYGEQYAQAIQVTSWKLPTIKQYQWVAERVPLANRRKDLSFFHHREIADMPVEKQRDWLAKASEGTDGESWGVDRLRREINTATRDVAEKIWVMALAKDHDDAEALSARLKGEGREVKIK